MAGPCLHDKRRGELPPPEMSDCRVTADSGRAPPCSRADRDAGVAVDGERQCLAYYRVSTQRQGRSGLGLEAQRDAVQALINRNGGRLLEEITKVESGKLAICRAKVSGARLIIAKLDRLSRNASFLLHLRDSGVRFIAADLPNADETVVGIMAMIAQREREMIAQREREMIAQRTRKALAVARKRLAGQGRALGNPNGAAALRRAGRSNSAAIAVGEAADNERKTCGR